MLFFSCYSSLMSVKVSWLIMFPPHFLRYSLEIPHLVLRNRAVSLLWRVRTWVEAGSIHAPAINASVRRLSKDAVKPVERCNGANFFSEGEDPVLKDPSEVLRALFTPRRFLYFISSASLTAPLLLSSIRIGFGSCRSSHVDWKILTPIVPSELYFMFNRLYYPLQVFSCTSYFLLRQNTGFSPAF